MHILLLESNTLLAKAYTTALQQVGYEVTPVSSAQAAIDAADARTPDVVVLELQLPAHGGLEFLHEFRSYAEWQRVPVVVQTILSPNKTRIAEDVLGRDLGVHAILYKPQTSLQALLDAVRAAAAAGPAGKRI